MQIRTYTEKSNARRAARAAGVNPDSVFQTEDGFTFSPPDHGCGNDVDTEASTAVRKDQNDEAFSPITFNGPAISESARANGSFDKHQKPDDDGIPAFCKILPEDRAETWVRNPPKVSPIRETNVAKSSNRKSAKPKADKIDKNALLLSMLKGKGSTVEALTKATDWQPHTLRARLSRIGKPKSRGGEGLKIERERVDGVTSYRLA